jgi:hypothetical protein
MPRKKPELVDVRIIQWDSENGVFGIVTVYDDGVVEKEPWGDILYTQQTLITRRKDIRPAARRWKADHK